MKQLWVQLKLPNKSSYCKFTFQRKHSSWLHNEHLYFYQHFHLHCKHCRRIRKTNPSIRWVNQPEQCIEQFMYSVCSFVERLNLNSLIFYCCGFFFCVGVDSHENRYEYSGNYALYVAQNLLVVNLVRNAVRLVFGKNLEKIRANI